MPAFWTMIVVVGTAAMATPAGAQRSAADNGRQPVLMEKIPLRFVPPSRMVELLDRQRVMSKSVAGAVPIPDGIELLTGSDDSTFLVVRGTAAAIAELRTIVDLFDLVPRKVRLRITLDRVGSRNGQTTAVSVGDAQIATLNNWPISLTFGTEDGMMGFQVWPRVNGDDSIVLMVGAAPDARPLPTAKPATRTMPINRRIRIGEELRVGVIVERSWAGGPARVRLQKLQAPDAEAQYRLTVTPAAVSANPTKSGVPGAPPKAL